MALDFNPQGFVMPAEGSGVKEEQDGVYEISFFRCLKRKYQGQEEAAASA